MNMQLDKVSEMIQTHHMNHLKATDYTIPLSNKNQSQLDRRI